MSRPSGPPPRPGQSPPTQRKSPKRGSSSQVLPSLITLVLIIALAMFFMAARAARKVAVPEERWETSKLEQKDFTLSYRHPEEWVAARQKAVARGSYRAAIGPRDSREQALFVTRYRLNDEARSDKDKQRLKREVRRSLRRTGAPSSLREIDAGRVDLKYTWGYQYQTRRLHIRTVFALDDKNLFQFSCQSAKGEKGKAKRETCEKILDSVDVD